MSAALTGWRVSAGDEHTVFDGNNCKIFSVQCGGTTGRSWDEATEIARLIEAAPDLLAVLRELLPHISAEVEQRKESGNDEYYADLERLEGLAVDAISKTRA